MNKTLKITGIILLAILVVIAGIRTFSNEDDWLCVNGEWVKHGNPSAPKPITFCEKSCLSDSDCKLPGEFIIQSNCPFSSVCINSKCAVICPLFEKTCSTNSDCDCSQRGSKTVECLCLKNECVSVEAE